MRAAALDRIAETVVDAKAAPAIACAAGFRVDGGWRFGVGAAGTLWPISEAPVGTDTVFDLASLTKPVVAIAAATESVRGRLDWYLALQQMLPELAGTWAASATLEQMLSHRAGLVAHRELFCRLRSGQPYDLVQLLRVAAGAKSEDSEDGVTRAVYSDLGYVLAGAAIERTLASPLDRWLLDLLPTLTRGQLGSVRSWLRWDSDWRRRCAPTEVVPWRGGLVWGRVHDENAWALSGYGLSGHAGLFGTAIGVARFGATVVDALTERTSSIPALAAKLVTRVRPAGTLCAGFDRKSAQDSTAGTGCSPETFGHLGFTGTSLWCDPTRCLVIAVLSNRVCTNRGNAALRAMRPNLHDKLFDWALNQRTGQSACVD